MLKLVALLSVIVITGSGALAQTPVTTPTPPDQTDVVKVTTALIQIDVTVTDKKGKVITDLRPEEIEIYENGEKQPITKFAFISNARTLEESDPRKAETSKPTVLPPTPVRPENVRRTIALVVDDLTLSFESAYYVRRALKKFVDEQMVDGDLVAIIRTGAGIGALQQFTTDRRQLYAAIERVRWNPVGTGNIGAFAPLEARIPTDPTAEPPQAGERTPEGIDREFDEFRESVFATGTLGAVNYVVRGMQDLPGRKSVLLLSDGFRLFTRDATGTREYGRVLDALRRLVDMANRASVVVYTLDARGLQVTGLTAADNTSGYSMAEVTAAMSDRRDQLLDTQDGLRYLAQQTGGLAIVNSNDLSRGIRKILDDQSYYLIGYEPEDETFDPRTRRFNKLDVKVTRPGTLVRYRSGFFGVSDDRIKRPAETPERRVINALTSPFSISQIALRLNALYYNVDKVGSVIRSLVHIRAQDLKFLDAPDGKKKAEFDVIAFTFGDNGAPVDQTGKSFDLTLSKEGYEKAMKTGFVYQFSLQIKKAGAYQLRIALRDRLTDNVGSANQFVEVPNLKRNRLTLSGLVLATFAQSDWDKQNVGGQAEGGNDALTDTALRQFKRGNVVTYGFSIYNAKPGPGGADLRYQARIFRDGKQIFEGQLQPVPAEAGQDSRVRNLTAALSLGSAMVPGDYILQVTVVDNLAGKKRNTATQFVQFEVTE